MSLDTLATCDLCETSVRHDKGGYPHGWWGMELSLIMGARAFSATGKWCICESCKDRIERNINAAPALMFSALKPVRP